METFAIKKTFFPKIGTIPFGSVLITKADFDPSKPTVGLCLFHGQGECGDGSLSALGKMAGWPGWFVDDKSPSFFGATNKWNFAIIMVQTTLSSRFSQGEIPFAISQITTLVKTIGKPVAVGLSLGGFGLINYGNGNPERLKAFRKMLFVMPGGGGNIGHEFPAAAVAAGLESLFFHAADDKVALPEQSIELNAGIKQLNGVSDLVMYVDGGHEIPGRPFNAFFPWASTNDGKYKTVPGSYIPTVSIYEWLTDQPVVGDKLIYKQEIYLRADGTAYAKALPVT